MDSSFRRGNKENVLRPFDNIANVSVSSLNRTFGFNVSKANINDSVSNVNDSFETENLKLESDGNQLEFYENQFNKLTNDNISLRKRNKNLTDLARLKEEQLIEALAEAKRNKEENENRNHQKYSKNLDNYYECFLQIENEKNCFKIKYEQILQEMENIKEKYESLETESGLTDNKIIEEITECNEELKKLSKEHVDTEIQQANSLAETVKIEEARKSILQQNIEVYITETIVSNPENEAQKQRIEELEVQKKMMETKLINIEAALARWIFRACDDKTELTKLKEHTTEMENEKTKFIKDIEQLREDRDNCLNLYKLNQVNLDETKSILSDKNCELEKLSTTRTKLEVEIHELNVKLSLLNKEIILVNAQTETYHPEICDIHTQTERQNISDIHTQTIEHDFNKKQTNGSTSSTKINEINSSGHVANIAAKFNGKVNISPVTSQSNMTGADSVDSAGVTNELKSVKIKNDHLILEKHSLKSKNEELKSENIDLRSKLKELERESEELATYITTSIEKHNEILPKSEPVNSTVPIVKNLATSGQQTSVSKFGKSTITTQTSSAVIASANSDALWQSRIEACRSEMKSEINKLHEINKSYNEQIAELKFKCSQLEIEIQEENAKISKMNILNKEISFHISNKNEEYLQLEHAMNEQANEFKKKKQIADTIIQQQKKLLDHIQSTGPNKVHSVEVSNKKTKIKSSKKNNPLLAHLNKPSIPYKFSHHTSATSQSSTGSETSNHNVKSLVTANTIEAELNSNYVAYSELNRIRRPPDMVPPPPQNQPQQQQQQTISKPIVQKPEQNKNIHVFITGLNTFPVYCHVCQHLIPLIAYASKCQICSFTCHSQCSNFSKYKSLTGTNNDDLFKYCQTNYMKTSLVYNNYVNKLIKTSYDKQIHYDKTQNHLLADYLHMYVDGKWKKLWVLLRTDGQLDLYQSRTNLKSFDNINLVSERIKFETDYSVIKKLLANYASQLSVSNTSIPNTSTNTYRSEDSVNLYEAVDQNQPRTDFTTSLVILLYTPKNCIQFGFDTFNKKIIWLDALQTSCLISSSVPQGIPTSNSSGNISKKLAVMAPNTTDKFKSFDLERALNPFLELSDFLSVNSFCFINENLIALACDDGLYVSEPGAANIKGAPSLSLVKINTIESAHKLNHQFGKLCLIGRRSRQFLAIDVEDLINAKVIHKNVSDDSTEENNSDDEEDEKLINVKIEHIHSIDRCHLFESSLNNKGKWYSAVATPETIFILLFNQNTSKFNLIKTINTQHDSPCLCLKFCQITNQLIYGCTKEFYKMDLTYLQPSPIIDNLVSTGKKLLADEELLSNSKKKQPISVSVINLNENESESVLLCYEEYALILSFNSSNQNWQLQNIQQITGGGKKNSTTSIGSSNNLSVSSLACLKWPRGLPPLQIEYDAPNLYLFYNDSIIVYKVINEEGLFVFKKSGIAFIYKPRFLSTLHIGGINCIIISNRRTSTPSVSGTELSEIANNRNIYNDYDTENEYNDDLDDLRSSSTKMNSIDDEDRICLSHFHPYD